jgi:hypothetical protein
VEWPIVKNVFVQAPLNKGTPSMRRPHRKRYGQNTLFQAVLWAHASRDKIGWRYFDDPRHKIPGGMSMKSKFKIGDHVSWNSEAGRVSGTIVSVHTRDFEVNGYTHHASAEAPQYEIKSSKTEHVAFHKGAALTRLRD